MAIAGLITDTRHCASGVVTIVFAGLFLLDAGRALCGNRHSTPRGDAASMSSARSRKGRLPTGQETVVWCACLHLHNHQDDIKIPPWFDYIIPPCVRPIIKRL